MEILAGLLFALIVIAIPFVVPIVAWVSARRARRRIDALENTVADQQRTIEAISQKLRELAASGGVTAQEQPAPVSAPPPVLEPVEPASIAPPVFEPVAPEPTPVSVAFEPPPLPVPPPEPAPIETAAFASVVTGAAAAEAPPVEPPPGEPPVLPQEPEPPPAPPFDWEGLVGVKLFSAIAGIALVFAAVFFLKYSIEHGWLQPPVRVAIGVLTAIALLVACELKAARQYPATANALDAAAIAILFATFFAAHALWNLIPAFVTFALLGIVTALAVLLSIRRDSLFIAVLGLLGGFATPALLSTGENRPIPLFAYLLMLNMGLAWIAYKQGWTILTWLTLILTTLYQWGWVMKFLDSASVPLGVHRVPAGQRRGVHARQAGRRRSGADAGPTDVRASGDDLRGAADRLRNLSRRGSGIRRTPRPSVRVPAADRRRPSGDCHRARARDAACNRHARGDADGCGVGGHVVFVRVPRHAAGVHGCLFAVLPVRAGDRPPVRPSVQ
jgi:hypothetical protein